MTFRYWINVLLLTMFLAGSLAAAQTGKGLVTAIKNHDKSAIRSLLQQRTNVNATEVDGTTPLHWAAYLDDLETASLIVRAGGNVKAANRHGVAINSAAARW